MSEDNGNRDLQQHLLEEIRGLKTKIDTLSEKLGDTNIEISKVAGMKHTVADIKKWKEGIEKVVNAGDIHDMKEDIEKLKVHRVQMITIGSIIGSIITLINMAVAFYAATN